MRVTSSIERTWMPPSSPRSGGGTRRLIRTGGTDGTGSLGVRGLKAASRPHRDCNLIYCVYMRSVVPLIKEIEILPASHYPEIMNNPGTWIILIPAKELKTGFLAR